MRLFCVLRGLSKNIKRFKSSSLTHQNFQKIAHFYPYGATTFFKIFFENFPYAQSISENRRK